MKSVGEALGVVLVGIKRLDDATMDQLVHGSDEVRSELAKNPTLRADLQEILAEDPYPKVRNELARRQDLSGTVALRLVTDENVGVRRVLAQHTQHAAALDRLTFDPDQGVTLELIRRNRPLTPGTSVRYAIRHHRFTFREQTRDLDQETLWSLAPSWDGNIQDLRTAISLTRR